MVDAQSFLFCDLERELAVTRKVLAVVPGEKFEWKPHAKSMSLGKLAIHVATLPEWMANALAQDVLDFANAPRPPQEVADNAALMALFEERVKGLKEAVAGFDPQTWEKMWTMKNGAQIFTQQPRWKVYKSWCFNHLIHHRGQLCVYLRLLDVKVPVVYFNTADEPDFVFE